MHAKTLDVYACRTVLAAARLSPEHEALMIEAIQHACYLNARNPFNVDTLIDLAGEIGLDPERFSAEISSDVVEAQMREEVAFARRFAHYRAARQLTYA